MYINKHTVIAAYLGAAFAHSESTQIAMKRAHSQMLAGNPDAALATIKGQLDQVDRAVESINRVLAEERGVE